MLGLFSHFAQALLCSFFDKSLHIPTVTSCNFHFLSLLQTVDLSKDNTYKEYQQTTSLVSYLWKDILNLYYENNLSIKFEQNTILEKKVKIVLFEILLFGGENISTYNGLIYF